MIRTNRIARFIRTLTGRMVLGELLIHSFLIPTLFFGINFIVKEGYESRFIEQANSTAALLATLVSHNISHQEIDNLLNDTVISKQVLSAKLIDENGNTIHSHPNDIAAPLFKEDQQFAQHGDNTYHVSTALVTNLGAPATLQTSFDERPIAVQIQQTYQVSIVLAIAYILITLILSGLLGQQLTRPIRKLRDDARAIAHGNTDKPLNATSSISEVASLIDNLETMKKALIKHSQDSIAREAHLRSVMDNVVDGIIITNTEGMIESLNPAAISLFDYTKGELIEEHINVLLDVNALLELEPRYHTYNESNISPAQNKLQETEGYRKSGATFPLEVAISKMIVNEQTHYIYVTHDITARKDAESELKHLHNELERRVIIRTSELAAANEELEHQALHDSLTDLPNRVLLLDRLNQSILTNRRNDTKLALFMIDLDRFKEINDTLGHHYGDIILQQVANRMREVLHQSNTVARLGGDEFAILLPAIEDAKEPANIATAIIHAIDQPFLLEEQAFHVGASIGVALFPEHGTDTSTLMRHADIAMYVAKKNNGDYTFYDSSLDQHSRDRLALTTELRHAIEHSQLRLHYQPKIDFKTGNVAEVEALVRWEHPRFGMMTPDHFIPLSEHTGLIRPLTLWVIREALDTCHQWHAMGHKLKVAVNLSTHNLHDPQLTKHIQQACQECGIDTSYLVLEITESAVMSDPIGAMKILGELSDMGISLSIDDFGTGYSSLAYLKQLPMDEIKIDKSFVMDMINDKDDYIIVRATIDLAHNMGRKVIAEGVESPEIWEILDRMGCDMAQGNYISTPRTADDFAQWLQDSQWSLQQA
jgi:diguanylate cyclase (GGDEF)-like protein/PAS domain S-box-containing protein